MKTLSRLTKASTAVRGAPRNHVAIALLAIGVLILTAGVLPPSSFAAYQAASAQGGDDIFKQAVEAYTQNRFKTAAELFKQVGGGHAEEAKAYLNKINAYIDAFQIADAQMRRSEDELDADNLDYAILKYEEAIKIKTDGPGKPQEGLERAKKMKMDVLARSKDNNRNVDRNLCDKALSASSAKHYKDAAQLSCALSNHNPGFQCGGDEALHLCQVMQEFASRAPMVQGDIPQKAKAAYDSNDFKLAKALFQRLSGGDKAIADEYLDKIGRYETFMASAEKSTRESNYVEANTAYAAAAQIKPDGPGNPQEQAATMDLLQGLDEFYAGKYVEAAQHLESSARESNKRTELVHFYLGASKLARFFLTGNNDEDVRQEALKDFRVAKQAGFDPRDQDVSPKILRVYREVEF